MRPRVIGLAGGLGALLALTWVILIGQPHAGQQPGRWVLAQVAGRSAPLAPLTPTTVLPSAAGPSPQTLANPNNGQIPANIDATIPYGPPLARTDWVITKDYAAHGGHSTTGAVDFAIVHDYQALGTPLLATHAGRVKLLQNDPTYGNLVYVIGAHYTTTYGHLQQFAVQDGDQVVRGTVLGAMGTTGDSTGPHVDYQVWQDGSNQDPLDYGIPGAQGAGPLH